MEQAKPEMLYHYTTMNSLWNILNNITNKGDAENPQYFIKLWISCADYMNDPMEGMFFRESLYQALMLYQNVHELEDKSDYMSMAFTALNLNRQTFFTFSLSEHHDSLNMWRSYGNNGQGVAIGFDVAELEKAVKGHEGCCFFGMDYMTKAEFVDTFTEGDMGMAYDAIEPKEDGCSIKYPDYEYLHDKYQHIKNSYYAEEREWRLMFLDELYKEKKFRERNGLIVPYYEVELPLEVVKCIVIGPCANQELSKSSLDSMLFHKAQGFREGEDKIRLSEVPYVLR